jgi:hypothetical protein
MEQLTGDFNLTAEELEAGAKSRLLLKGNFGSVISE